jgi:hypothetical protein
MMTITRGLAAAALLAGAWVGLAGPASAEAPSGTYTATVTEASGSVGPAPLSSGQTLTWLLTTCGADCTHLEVNPPNAKSQVDMHLQGGSWMTGGSDNLGCTKTMNAEASAATEVCPMWTIQYGLTRNS